MSQGDDTVERGRGRQSKVARFIEKYDLEGMGAELEERWAAEEDCMSLLG